jgi:hypothetical protein
MHLFDPKMYDGVRRSPGHSHARVGRHVSHHFEALYHTAHHLDVELAAGEADFVEYAPIWSYGVLCERPDLSLGRLAVVVRVALAEQPRPSGRHAAVDHSLGQVAGEFRVIVFDPCFRSAEAVARGEEADAGIGSGS